LKRALYTGSFDPITLGHLDLIHRCSQVFNEVIIGIGINPTKKYLFDIDKRIELIKNNIVNKNISIIKIENGRLSADIAYELDAVLIKGIRMGNDFDYERLINDINHIHNLKLDTFILPAQPNLQSVSSSAAKEIVKLNGNLEQFVPINVKAALEKEITGQTRIGLTGVIGSGKSTIVKELLKLSTPKFPIHNIDLDIIANDILFVLKDPSYVLLRNYLSDYFKINWNKKELGEIVFGDKGKRDFLNETLKMPIMARIRYELNNKNGIIVFNGALLIEAKLLHLHNNNLVLLEVNRKDQINRLKDRGHNSEQIKRRINAQLSTSEKCKLSILQQIKDKYGTGVQYNTSEFSALTIAKNILEFANNLI